LHDEELRDFFKSPVIVRIVKSRRLRWARLVARIGKTRNAHAVFVGTSIGKRPLGGPRR
jgi:hypothetical protein